jgi:uncharacterized membrane protein YeaQ/YmgE (transglycosylase-associated protein family)
MSRGANRTVHRRDTPHGDDRTIKRGNLEIVSQFAIASMQSYGTVSALLLSDWMNSRMERTSQMHILGWIFFGLVVGVVAKLLMPGRDPGGFIVTILLGIAGALVGGWIGRAVGWYQPGDPVGFIMAVLGAIVILAIYHVTVRRAA